MFNKLSIVNLCIVDLAKRTENYVLKLYVEKYKFMLSPLNHYNL